MSGGPVKRDHVTSAHIGPKSLQDPGPTTRIWTTDSPRSGSFWVRWTLARGLLPSTRWIPPSNGRRHPTIVSAFLMELIESQLLRPLHGDGAFLVARHRGDKLGSAWSGHRPG
jgi:hypothetical protein